ncbi:MAG: YceI family protein, partial [Thermoanaerobaculia bacterium]|nr:YceI family protein [Thermoanaerobaculia bacterium]
MTLSKQTRCLVRVSLLVLLSLALGALPGLSSKQTLTLDPEATEVTFELGATGHDVEGSLYLRSGELTLDFEGGTASGEITIDAVRTETGNEKRDRDMHEKVLESSLFPVFVFSASGLRGALATEGPSSIQLIGSISIHGEDHPLTLPVTVHEEAGQLIANATFDIPYVEWGMKDPSIFVLRVAKVVVV